MRPVQTQVDSSVMPRALIVGAGPEALIGIEPMLGTNRFRVDFLDKHDTPYSAIRLLRPDLVVLCFAPDDGEAYAIISSQWPRTTSGIPSASNSWGRYTAR